MGVRCGERQLGDTGVGVKCGEGQSRGARCGGCVVRDSRGNTGVGVRCGEGQLRGDRSVGEVR